MSGEYDGPNYAELSPPSDKPPDEYSYVERRAELYRLIEEAGHPHNLERSQRELGKRYDVSQKQISKDIQRLREFEQATGSDRAVSVTSWLAEKAVMQKVEADEFDEALQLQMEYNSFLFDLGELDESPTDVNLNVDPEQAYMQMLRDAAQTRDDAE